MRKENLRLEVSSTYRYLINNCRPETVTAPRVLGFLGRARQFANSFECELTEADAVRTRVSLRNAAQTLLKRADWLGADARQALLSFIHEQPEFLSAGDYRFTNDFFSVNIPNWQRSLGHFAAQPDLSFLEVGSYEGQSACWLLEHILTDESSRITCIDVFKLEKSQDVYDATGVDSASMSPEDRFDHNILQTGAKHRVVKIKGSSGCFLRTLPLAAYHFIYIDGSHVARDVLEDAVLAWELLKTGGVIIFDDYLWRGNPDRLLRPQIAIEAFLKVYEGHYRLVDRAYQITLEKLS